MKKILLVFIMAVLRFVSTGCSQQPEEVSTKEQTIIELALYDIRDEVDESKADEAMLFYLFTEDAPWIEWDCTTYLLFVDERLFVVGVQEKGNEVHFVDVTGELADANN